MKRLTRAAWRIVYFLSDPLGRWFTALADEAYYRIHRGTPI